MKNPNFDHLAGKAKDLLEEQPDIQCSGSFYPTLSGTEAEGDGAEAIKVLHVEDDADIREITRMALSLSGDFDVVQCTCGEETLKLVETYRPDIFLFDLMMPRMTGEQLLWQLRREPVLRDIPAVFMTARAQEIDIAKLQAAGAIAVIRKPFDPLTLGEQIRGAIGADLLARPH